jgi:nucleoside-diphosphate-sugar epimerase
MGVPVVAMVRNKAKATKDGGVLLNELVTVVEGDVCRFDTLPAAISGCDVVLCATGCRPALDPLGPFNVDYQGTKNLVVAAARAEVKVSPPSPPEGQGISRPKNMFADLLRRVGSAALRVRD